MFRGEIFEKKSIPQLIFLFSIPTICSLVLESVSSMIDTAFAGHLGSISNNALSAMGILSPVLSLLIAAQLIFGVSTSIVIAKRLGEKDKEKINNTFKVGLYASFIFSTAISLFILLVQDKLIYILGATGEVGILAKEYLNIAIIFNVFSSTGYTLVNNIRAFGYPNIEIIVVISSTIINIVFNVIFTFIMNMGIRGIALSTLISEVCYLLFTVIFLVKKGLWIKKSKLNKYEVKEILYSLIKIGFVQFLMQALNSLSGFVINKVLIRYTSILYIGSWTICSNIHMIVLLPLIGLAQGIQSIIAYYQGSKDEKRKNIVKSNTIKYSLVYSISVTAIVYLFSREIVGIFTRDLELISLSVPIIRIVLAGFPFIGIIYTFITFMQVSGEENSASKLELIRQGLLLIPLTIILPIIFTKYDIMNISPKIGIFLAMPISNCVLLIVYSIYLKKVEGDRCDRIQGDDL
ncbi:MAG: MATE family efflux transporter [Peptostreptococcaceae bacterium]|nr:MATE family efflux transporter [Peptostreptococcaceae bacterium]